MTLKKLLFLKAFAGLCIAVSNTQSGFDPFAIYQGSPIPLFPRNTGALIDHPRFNGPRSHAGFTESFLKSHDGVQPYSSNLFEADYLNNLKSTSSLPKEYDDDREYRGKPRHNDDDYDPPSRPHPKYFDKPSSRPHYPEDKQEKRPQSPRPRPSRPQGPRAGYYSASSNEVPMIFAFRLEKRMWEEDLRNRVNSLRNVNFVDEMEGYAKPSMQVGRLLEWFRGMRKKDTKTSGSLVTKTSSTQALSAKSGEKIDHYNVNEPPIYYTRTKTVTDTVRGGNPNIYSSKKPIGTPYPIAPHSPTPVPPIVFGGHVDDHHEHGPDHYPNIYDDSKATDIPLSNILKQTAGKGRPNFNPKCNKGGSMIFCNSDALMGLLDLLEEHMGHTNKQTQHQNVNQNVNQNQGQIGYVNNHIKQYGQNVKFPHHDGYGPPRIEVIEMDPNDGRLLYDHQSVKPNKGVPQKSKDFNQIHDVEHLNENYNSHKIQGSSGFGIEDANKEVEIVIVVHTDQGSFGKNSHHKNEFKNNNYGVGNIGGGGHSGGHGNGKNNGQDKYRKPYRHFDDDELQNNYDKKFDRLKKVLDIVRQRNNNAGVGNYGWGKDNQFRGNQYGHGYGGYGNNFGHGDGHGNQYGVGFSPERKNGPGKGKAPKGDDYWNSLFDEYQFGNYIPLQNAKDGPPSQSHSHRRPGPEIEEDPNYFNDGGLYIDMKDDDYYSYGRERNPDRLGKMPEEQHFGLARAGKSKHASKQEKGNAIRKKLEQVYMGRYSRHSRN